jgi:hypothetical protein
MDDQSSVPVEGIPPALGVWVRYTGVQVEELCGTVVNAFGECTTPGNPALSNVFCTAFACKQTSLQPLP